MSGEWQEVAVTTLYSNKDGNINAVRWVIKSSSTRKPLSLNIGVMAGEVLGFPKNIRIQVRDGMIRFRPYQDGVDAGVAVAVPVYGDKKKPTTVSTRVDFSPTGARVGELWPWVWDGDWIVAARNGYSGPIDK